jgi:hypothetical protein
VKRQLTIAMLAVAAAGLSGCGGDDGNARSAGKDIGAGIGSLQTTVMTRMADFRIAGIEDSISSLEDVLPADAYKELQDIQAKLDDDVDAATNHPDALAQASVDAQARIARLADTNSTVREFQKGFAEGYAKATS